MSRYRCIVADPPWRYRDRGCQGAAEKHYCTMSAREIAGLADAVRSIADEHAYLFLWTTSSFLAEGAATMITRAWGFQPCQVGAWVKPQMGLGRHLRIAAEFFIVATRGKPRRNVCDVTNWFSADRLRHSEKPDEFFRRIERFCDGPRLEMFARQARPGWDSWGDEAPTTTKIAIGA